MSAPEHIDVRVLADDLTGALDSAVAFASSDNGIAVTWRLEREPVERMAVDVATREGRRADAVARHLAFARWLAAGQVSFKKIDSLLRGHVVAEIAACVDGGDYERVIIAPAFPFQGRVTRLGRQWRIDRMEVAGPDIAAGLARRFPTGRAAPGTKPEQAITVYDAETSADIDTIVATAMGSGLRTLWVGSGGLARALARNMSTANEAVSLLPSPFLGLVGTNNEVTKRQVRCFAAQHAGAHIVIDNDAGSAKNRLMDRMGRGAPSVVSVAASGPPDAVTHHIEAAFAELLNGLPRPGTLLVTGGETLRSVCNNLGAERLVVESAIEPGLPVSRIRGGVFDGQITISKSGAFGDADIFSRLCRSALA